MPRELQEAYEILIRGRVPMAQNKLLRAHWATQKREKDAWRLLILGIARKCPRLVEKVDRPKVEILVRRWKQAQDPDNATGSCKFLIDALKRMGWLYDDANPFIDLSVTEEKVTKREDQLTVIRWSLPLRPWEGTKTA